MAGAAVVPLTRREETALWLSRYLASQPSRAATYEAVLDAVLAAGYAEKTLQDASRDIGVVKTARGPHTSVWYLPQRQDEKALQRAVETVEEILGLDGLAQASAILDLVGSLPEHAFREVVMTAALTREQS